MLPLEFGDESDATVGEPFFDNAELPVSIRVLPQWGGPTQQARIDAYTDNGNAAQPAATLHASYRDHTARSPQRSDESEAKAKPPATNGPDPFSSGRRSFCVALGAPDATILSARPADLPRRPPTKCASRRSSRPGRRRMRKEGYITHSYNFCSISPGSVRHRIQARCPRACQARSRRGQLRAVGTV